MSSDSQSSALLAHIVSQTRSNLDFLVSQNYLQASDAAGILSKLTSIDDSEGSSNPVLSIAERTRQLSIIDRNAGAGMPERAQSPPKAIMPARRNIPPPPPPPVRTQQARALWDYNEINTDPNDLSFRAGDTIEIVSETNPDWWTGKLHGRQGLFPSNYVEKLDTSRAPASPGRAPIPVPAPIGRMGSPASSYGGPPSNYASPPPFAGGAPYAPAPQWQNGPSPGPPAWQQAPQFGPPQPYGGYEKQPVYAPLPPPQQLEPPPPPPAPAPEKKSRFGGLGATMANSAAGGVGFGAGAAIGSGIIDSIF